MNNKLWVVIPYYRDPEALSRCLDSLSQSTFKDIEIFVRDNSNDNILFTAAVNEGIQAGLKDAEVGCFLILNQDCYVEPGTLEALRSHLMRFSDCGIACPLQMDASGDITWGGSLDAFPLGRHFKMPIEEYQAPFATYWANGASMLLRRSMVEEIGLLDKNLRFVCSDSDYSFTARARGWEVHVVPAARCEHSLNASAKSGSPEINVAKVKDVIYFYEKWISGDLYRRMSHEGPALVSEEIESWIQGLRADVQIWDKSTQGGPTSEVQAGNFPTEQSAEK